MTANRVSALQILWARRAAELLDGNEKDCIRSAQRVANATELV
jgi:hypothetical protein